MLEQFVLVDENGIQVDVVLLNPEIDEITKYHVPANLEGGLFLPTWNFEELKWEEGLSEEEVALKKAEIEEQLANVVTFDDLVAENKKLQEENERLKEESEMNSFAIMELAEAIYGMYE